MTAEVSDMLDFLAQLRRAEIHYQLSDPTAGAIMVQVSVPGERWEVEFLSDGDIQVEVFRSTGEILGPQLLKHLLDAFAG